MGLIVTPRDMESAGYYSVAGRMYFHKYEALEDSIARSAPVSFHWNDDFWNAQDWTVEPQFTLRALYRKRAEQLRLKYDYLILCLSGGADSENVLRAFDTNNILLDEIVSWHDLGLSNNRESNVSAEVFNVAILKAQAFCARHPETVYTLLDTRDHLLPTFNMLTDDDMLLAYLSTISSMGSPMRGGCWFYTEPRYSKLIDAGKRIAIIWGVDKTLIFAFGAEYFFFFNDDFTKRNRKAVLFPSRPVIDEFFYWSTDCPELVIKQCHRLVSNLDALPIHYVDLHRIDYHNQMQTTYLYSRRRQVVSLNTVNEWLYGWDAATFSLGKIGGSFFASGLDDWVAAHRNEDATRKWDKVNQFARKCYEDSHARPIMFSQPYSLSKTGESWKSSVGLQMTKRTGPRLSQPGR